MIDVIRRGFDGLDVAFEARISHTLSDKLNEAKELAVTKKEPTFFEYNRVRMHVADSGARGGYAFRCDTGPDGATWFFKEPNGNDPWGIRVSVKSLTLALYGLGGARAQIYEFLDGIGVHVSEGAESISRVDYCVDHLMPGFELCPENFVMHARTNRADHTDIEMHRNGTSGRVSSVTIGKMPGRQIIVYDKRKEVIDKRKTFWWKIWNSARDHGGLPLLNPDDKEDAQVWRVELRAGKQHLKNRWGVRKWADLDDKLGDIFKLALNEIRYAIPATDGNRSRWQNHPLWDVVRNEVSGDLFEMECGAEPSVIKEVIRDELRRILNRQYTGLTATYAVVMGISPENADEVPEIIKNDLRRFAMFQPGELEKKMERAKERYVFLETDPVHHVT